MLRYRSGAIKVFIASDNSLVAILPASQTTV
jgi:hypothetical protein